MSQNTEQQKKEDLLSDKDVLLSKLDQAQEQFTKLLSDVDKNLMGGIRDDVKNKQESIKKNQHDRNRRVVKEIIDTCN